MKTFLLTIGLVLCGILTPFLHAQSIPLTIDSTLSSVDVSIAGFESSSQLLGNATFELQPSVTQPETAQFTELNLVLDDALNFSLFGGFASGSTSPGDVTISMTTPGAPGTVTANAFNQLANVLTTAGDLDIVDSLGFAGGNQTFDLSDVTFAPVDFNSVNITQLGNLITVSGSATMTGSLNLGAGDLPVVIEMDYVANGIVTVPVVLGDVNLDGAVTPSDIMPFISVLATGGFQAEADCDLSEVVNFLDISPFITELRGR